LNKNNKVLSIFTMVAVFAMGIAAHSYQNAAATIQDPQDAISDAQNALSRVSSFPSIDDNASSSIAEGQEGLANVSSMLSGLNGGGGLSPLGQGADSFGGQNTDPLGQGSSILDQGIGSLDNSTTSTDQQ
jgi:hypothetical protein